MRQYLDIFPATEKTRTHNSTFAIGGVSCSADSFVVNGSLVFQIKFCGESPAHRKSAERYLQFYTNRKNEKTIDSWNFDNFVYNQFFLCII